MVSKAILLLATAVSVVSYKVYKWQTSKTEKAEDDCQSDSTGNHEDAELKRWIDRLNRLKPDEVEKKGRSYNLPVEDVDEELKRLIDRVNRLNADEVETKGRSYNLPDEDAGMTVERQHTFPDGSSQIVKYSLPAKYLDLVFTKANTNANTTLDEHPVCTNTSTNATNALNILERMMERGPNERIVKSDFNSDVRNDALELFNHPVFTKISTSANNILNILNRLERIKGRGPNERIVKSDCNFDLLNDALERIDEFESDPDIHLYLMEGSRMKEIYPNERIVEWDCYADVLDDALERMKKFEVYPELGLYFMKESHIAEAFRDAKESKDQEPQQVVFEASNLELLDEELDSKASEMSSEMSSEISLKFSSEMSSSSEESQEASSWENI